jgi:amino acid adenylation domain-containing protein
LQPHLQNKRVGILGSRSIAAYVGIIGAAWSGATYVPLNMKWPAARLIEVIKNLELDAILLDATGAKLITEEARAAAPAIIVACDPFNVTEGFQGLADLQADPIAEPVFMEAKELGYIEFTSGTTGMPKGVMVSCSALAHYLDETRPGAGFTAQDRVAEAQDITFDLSIHNMFLAWEAGSSLHLMTALDMMAPQAFVRKREISVWMSVPTIVNNMRRSGSLKPGLFPSLRLSFFCGEPLGMTTVNAWAEAAPNSAIENIYGPTECTIACTRQPLIDCPPVTEERDILSIGDPSGNVGVMICDRNAEQVCDGQVGEIVLSGPQLAEGYFKSPEQTAKAFRLIDGKRWYFTGDLGYRNPEDGKFHHMGRVDNQVKMKGNRIELEEVDTHLRKACDTVLAVVVAWPVIDGSAQGLVGFTTNQDLDEKQIRAKMARNLPEYMVPGRIERRSQLPRTANDKIDRNALVMELDRLANTPSMETPMATKQGEPV